MISVCVPTYNGATYLAVAVESILAQTFLDFEVLIVDDASTDGTLEVARKLAASDPRVRIERNPTNLGLVRNWNRCVELARGEWIKFVFQDDFLAPTCLSRLVETAGRTGSRFVFCERKILIEPEADPQLARTFEHHLVRFGDVFGDQLLVPAVDLCLAFLNRLGTNFLGEPTSALIHRSCFAKYGVFNERFVQLCDIEYWYRVGCHEGIALIPNELATFRVHSASATSANFATAARETRTAIDLVLLYTAVLDDPRLAPLRASYADAVSRIQSQFVQEFKTIDDRLLRDGNDFQGVLSGIWGQAKIENPSIERLWRRIVPGWRRAARRLRAGVSRPAGAVLWHGSH